MHVAFDKGISKVNVMLPPQIKSVLRAVRKCCSSITAEGSSPPDLIAPPTLQRPPHPRSPFPALRFKGRDYVIFVGFWERLQTSGPAWRGPPSVACGGLFEDAARAQCRALHHRPHRGESQTRRRVTSGDRCWKVLPLRNSGV